MARARKSPIPIDKDLVEATRAASTRMRSTVGHHQRGTIVKEKAKAICMVVAMQYINVLERQEGLPETPWPDHLKSKRNWLEKVEQAGSSAS